MALDGSDFIVHAGDIGDAAILAWLAKIAPVTAVRGNNDIGGWANGIPGTQRLDVGGKRIFVIHDLAAIAIDPIAERLDVVVSGHSHRPKCERRGNVLYVNPGSAGPRRFRLPIAVGVLTIEGADVDAELVMLDDAVARATRPAAVASISR